MAENDSDTTENLSGELKLTLPLNAVSDRDSANFAERLKQARNARGLTLRGLSLVTKAVDPLGQGVSTVSISRYESGAEPGLRELRLLSLALHRSLSYLVYGSAEDPLSPSSKGMVSLDLLVEDIVAETVSTILEKHGIVSPSKTKDLRNQGQYEALLEAIKKL